jgi:hypothetical protein
MLGLAAVGAMTWWQNDLLDTADGAVWLIRVCALLMTLAAVFVLDDSSRRMTESMVMKRRLRTGVRLAGGTLLLVVGCALPAALAVGDLAQSKAWTGVVIEVAALAAVAAAASLTMQRRFEVDEPGQYVVLALVGLLLLLQAMSARWPMLVGPGPEWTKAHVRWAVVLVLGVVVVVWHLRDPAAPGLRAALHRSRTAE